MINLDDTSACPAAAECEVCGGLRGALLDVVTATTQVGVHCLTICDTCREMCSASLVMPPVNVVHAADRAARHAGHLGIDLDQMAAAMTAEAEG